MRNHRHRIVVSAENRPYIAWQVMLFYFSCVTRLKQQPLVIVHETSGEPHHYFRHVVRAGGIVRRAPSYAVTAWGDVYPPRNTAGTLLHAAELCRAEDEFIVLCDPDMLFVREQEFPATLSGDYYSYMNYSAEEVADAARRVGLDPERLRAYKDELKCGVPYVIPVAEARPLARAWLEAVDAFAPRRWIDIMHAYGIAAAGLNLKPSLRRTVDFNQRPDTPLTREVVHYCYGSERWSKKHYMTDEQVRGVWTPPSDVPGQTVLAEICSQIEEAREFYRDPFNDARL